MNQYPGYCVDCDRQVKAGHGDLKKRGGKYVVSCGRNAVAKPAAPPAPKPERPQGVRITDLRITSLNATLAVGFAVNGIGYATAYAPFRSAAGNKHKPFGPWTPEGYAPNADLDLERARYERHAEQQAKRFEANQAMFAALKAAGNVTHESEYEFHFLLSAEEETMLVRFIADQKATLLAAILDGTAKIQSMGSITLPGEEKPLDFALSYDLLVHDLHLRFDGKRELEDLAGAIRNRQAQFAEADARKAEHKAKRAQGHHVVAMKRCWECGRTQILGELDDNMMLVRMAPDVYSECVSEQKAAHERSLATVPAGTILSSVGFAPDPKSSFEFRVIENDWYCGC